MGDSIEGFFGDGVGRDLESLVGYVEASLY